MREVYVLDRTTLERIDLIEGVHSFVWTIRYDMYGDFILKVPISRFPYTSLRVGNYVEIPESERLMIIDSVNRQRDTGSDDLIVVEGRSLEAFFMERYITPEGDDEHWTLKGHVGWIATELVRRVCIAGTELSTNDIIPNLKALTQDASTIERTVKLPPQDLYKSISELCKEDKLGFRVFFDKDTKDFVFRVYRGTDRSASQSTNAKVIFSNDLDNLINGSFLKSSVNYKNIAYVRSGAMVRRVQIASGVFTGMRRRVMYVDANDIKNPTATLLDSRGRLELAKQPFLTLFDGEIQTTASYTLGVDYTIGDLVSLKGEDGGIRDARVTELVTTYDHDGIRRYPTFTSVEAGT